MSFHRACCCDSEPALECCGQFPYAPPATAGNPGYFVTINASLYMVYSGSRVFQSNASGAPIVRSMAREIDTEQYDGDRISCRSVQAIDQLVVPEGLWHQNGIFDPKDVQLRLIGTVSQSATGADNTTSIGMRFEDVASSFTRLCAIISQWDESEQELETSWFVTMGSNFGTVNPATLAGAGIVIAESLSFDAAGPNGTAGDFSLSIRYLPGDGPSMRAAFVNAGYQDPGFEWFDIQLSGTLSNQLHPC